MTKKILVIDDEELLIRTFSKLLEKIGYEVFIAKKGYDAICMAEEEDFDLVLTDVRMPGINGVETLVRLRAIFLERGTKKPYEIVMSGYSDQETEEKIKNLKPNEFLRKPFDVNELVLKVKNLIG